MKDLGGGLFLDSGKETANGGTVVMEEYYLGISIYRKSWRRTLVRTRVFRMGYLVMGLRATVMGLVNGLKYKCSMYHYKKTSLELGCTSTHFAYREADLHDTIKQYILELPWDFEIRHTKRAGNNCVDVLAQMGHDVEGLHLWKEPPQPVIPALQEDSVGVTWRPCDLLVCRSSIVISYTQSKK